MGPFDPWAVLAQFGQAAPSPDAPDPMVARQEGLDGGHGNDGNRSRMGMARPGAPTWRGMNWADRLTALGAIVGDLDPRAQGRNYAGFREEFAGRGDAERERAKAEAEAARRQQFQQAYQASIGPDGQLDPAKLQRNLAPFISDISDIGALRTAARDPQPRRYVVNGQIVEEGADGTLAPVYSTGGEYVSGPNGSQVWRPNGPAQPQRRAVPPEIAAQAVPINPTSAAPSGAAAPQGNVSYAAPFNMRPSSPFGPRTPPKTRGGRGSRNHGGIDYPVGVGTAVPSAAEGEVIFAGNLGGYGNTVKVRHPDGSVTQYSHLRSPSVRRGDRIAAGAPVGESGDTGNVSGPHLHFGAYDAQGRPIDPATRYRR